MRHWLGRAGAALSGLALTLAMGCAGFFVYPGSLNNSSGASGDYVYVADATTQTLAGFAIGTGTLTAVTNSPYSLSIVPTAVAVNPADTIVFAAGNSSIYAFAIESGGGLSELNNGSPVGYANVKSMDISPDGQWLLVLDGNGTTVDEFQINSSTGLLTQMTGASYTVTGATVLPTAIKIAPNGELVFIALGTAGDLVYTFTTSSGALASSQQLSLPTTTTSDNALAVSPNSSYLYIARSGTDGGLAAYSIGTNGALAPVSGSSFAAGNQPFSVVVNNAGTDVYVANQLDSTISGYSVASDGTLTALADSPYTAGSSVTALAVERTGDYLLAAARGGSPDLAMYSFDSGIAGKLDLSTTTATGTDPTMPVALATTH
ncbi:MAG: beta-propeller fold lactonase family protein [Acidobacteriaceae bacterium]|jgi:6-phosphogluconolactonase (cycloisomerase 2 family)